MPYSYSRVHHGRDDSGYEGSTDSPVAMKERRRRRRRDDSSDARRSYSAENDRSRSVQRRASRSRSHRSVQKNGGRGRGGSVSDGNRHRRGSPRDTRRDYTSRRESPGHRPSPHSSRNYTTHAHSPDTSSSPPTHHTSSSRRQHYLRQSPRGRSSSLARNAAVKQRRGYYGPGKGGRYVSPPDRRRSYYRGSSPEGRGRTGSSSPKRQSYYGPSSRRHRPRSSSAGSPSKRRPRSVEKKSPSPRPERPAKRAWKFDSPPREGGAEGDGPQQQSPMGLLAQSLGLSAEQQKASRELYIGNLPPALDVNQLIEFFNAAMLTLKASSIPGNPVSRAWIASDGHFAFVEFRTIEEATIGLQLNGLNCMGYALRIGRPKTYPSEYATLLSVTSFDGSGGVFPSLSAAAAASTITTLHVPSSPASAMLAAQAAAAGIGIAKRAIERRADRLVMLDLPPSPACSQDQIKSVLTNFGPLKVFQYFEVPETDGRPATGVCVFEYNDYASQKWMEKGLSEQRIDGKELQYVLADDAIREGKLSEVMTQAAQAGRNLQEELGGELMRPQVPTRVIMFTNIVTRDELLDDKEYFDIVDDIFIECSHHGKVVSVEIPRPACVLTGAAGGDDAANGTVDESDVGCAFVKFARLQGAGAARRGLSGRKFAGRTVEAHYFSEVLFRDKQFKNPQPNCDPVGRLLDSPTADDANEEDVQLVAEEQQLSGSTGKWDLAGDDTEAVPEAVNELPQDMIN